MRSGARGLKTPAPTIIECNSFLPRASVSSEGEIQGRQEPPDLLIFLTSCKSFLAGEGRAKRSDRHTWHVKERVSRQTRHSPHDSGPYTAARAPHRAY